MPVEHITRFSEKLALVAMARFNDLWYQVEI